MRLPVLVMLWVLSMAPLPVPAAPAAPFLMGSVDPPASYLFKWYGLIYSEAFRRLGLTMELSTYPTQRIGVLLDQGAIDGEVARARIYAEAHPELIRVEESVFDVDFALYTAKPKLVVSSLAELRALKLSAGYRRGVVYCEKELNSALPAAQVVDLTQEEQGLQMLLSGRIDVFCGTDFSVLSALASPTLKDASAVRKLTTLQLAPLYPYLHRKHAEWAPQLAAVLKAMKTEGLVERYRLQALREFGR